MPAQMCFWNWMMSGYVYAIGIEATTYVKIGHAGSPERRLAGMQGSLPFKLELLYTLQVEHPLAVERTLHEMLAPARVRGEWFEMPETSLEELFAAGVERAKELSRCDTNSPSGFGERLRSMRRQQNLTQQELAEKAGVNFVTISRIEQKEDETSIYWGTAKRLAKALGVSLNYFAEPDEDEEVEDSPKPVKKPKRTQARKARGAR